MGDGGKGSRQRPTNEELYSDGYDRIFGMRCKDCDYKQRRTEGQPVLCETCGKEL